MKMNNDAIVLESRREIDTICNIVDKAVNSGTLTQEEKEAAKRLIDLLDAMYMCW